MTFKKGDFLIITIGLNSRNPLYFQNPNEFDFNRFSKTTTDENFVYIPFYGGPRNCIGQHMATIEMKLYLRDVLKRYRL